MKLLTKLTMFAVVGGLGAGTMYAAPNGYWLDGDGSVSGGGGASVAPAPSVPAADMLARVSTLKEQMSIDARYVQHLQQVARKDKDVIKLNCVNDKLVQIRPLMNVADHTVLQLQASDLGGRMALYTQITENADSVHRLREEADQCIGEPALSVESSNSFTGPTVDNPYTYPWGAGIEPPGYASPFN